MSVDPDSLEVEKKIPRYVKIGVFVAILLIGCTFAAKPAAKYVFAKRFSSSLAEAKQNLAAGKRQQAEENLLVAWQVSNKETNQLRELLEISHLIPSKESVVIASSLFISQKATPQDRTLALDVLSRLGLAPAFEPLYDRLPESEKSLTANRISRARHFYASQQLDAAIEEIEKAAVNPKDHLAHLALIDLLLDKKKPICSEEDFEKAQTRISQLVRILMESDETEAALNGIYRITKLENPLKFFRHPELERWINEHDKQNKLIKERLFLLSLRINEMPESIRSEAIGKVFEQYRESFPDELVDWLVQMNAVDWVAKLSPEAREKSLPTYFAYLEYLLQYEKWTEATEWLLKAPQRADKIIIEATLSAVAFKQGDNAKNFHYWDRAFQAASFEGKYANFFTILTIAERMGDTNTARRVAEVITEAPTLSLPATEELYYLDRHLSNKPEKLLSFYEKLHASREKDSSALLKYAQLIIVTGKDIPRARKVIQSGSRNPATEYSFLCAEALCHLAENGEKAALALIEKSGLKWDKSKSAADTAIFATILYKTGQADEAVRLSSFIQWEKGALHLKSYLLNYWKNESTVDSQKMTSNCQI
ncbi:MAG: hypothetical protein HC845_03115 [Akkermansiaceae bacterium]|nr:hypothetical protein [Akkermansiaceae bacterium]